MSSICRLLRLHKGSSRPSSSNAFWQTMLSLQARTLRLFRPLAPLLLSLSIAAVAHAQGTMDFSGAQTLMGTFKYQVLWRVDGIDFETQESTLKQLSAAFGGDPACTDCNRVLRIPGFVNCKYTSGHVVSAEYSSSEVDDLHLAQPIYVVMETAPPFYRDPKALNPTYIHSSGSKSVPLQAFAKANAATSPLTVNHSSFFPSVTISFNLAPGTSLGHAATDINQMQRRIDTPPSVRGQFAGTAEALYEASRGARG